LSLNPILTTPDILIIGGGSAGVAAAVGANRSGVSVVLLEKNGFLGGKATAAYVGTVCGLYYRSENPNSNFVNKGFPEQFTTELMHKSESKPVMHKNGLHFLPYRQFDFMMLCDEYGLRYTDSLALHAYVTSATLENNSITCVEAMIYHQPIKFYPKVVIDTSGEAILATLIGSDVIKSDQYQASAHVFMLAGFPDVDQEVIKLSLFRSIKSGIADGKLNAHYDRISIVPGSVKNGQALFKLGIPITIDNNPIHISEIELFSRKAIDELIKYLKSNNELFKNCWLAMIAPETGIRTGPRHKGLLVLEESDVLNCKKSNDSVARGAWPIEYWEPGKNPEMGYFAMDDYYDISAGTLQSNRIRNLFFAGRNLSATDKAIASARVIGTCLATGYAAGVLASGMVFNKCREESILTIQKELFSLNSI